MVPCWPSEGPGSGRQGSGTALSAGTRGIPGTRGCFCFFCGGRESSPERSRAAGEVWRAALCSGSLPCQLHVLPSIASCQVGQGGAGNWLGESRSPGGDLETSSLHCQVKHLIKRFGFEERWLGADLAPPPRPGCSVPGGGVKSCSPLPWKSTETPCESS